MNIFILDLDPVISASMLCDKHVVKMIVESAQMLSTAHRILDGKFEIGLSKTGKRKIKKWHHPNEELYDAVHINHPCTVWTMQRSENYIWHYNYFIAMSNEYTYRYEKIHKSYSLLKDVLKELPNGIYKGSMTQFPLAMKSNPECMFPDDPVKSYRMYYKAKKNKFNMKWTKRDIPAWFE